MNNQYKPWLLAADALVAKARANMPEMGPDYDAWIMSRGAIQSAVFGMLNGDISFPAVDNGPDYRYLAVMAAMKLNGFESGMADSVFECWRACYHEWRENEGGK